MLLKLFLIGLLPIIAHGTENNFDSPAVYQVTPPVDHAECPTWDAKRNLLFYVDIHNGQILSYDYKTKETHSIKLDGSVAIVIPSKTDPNLLIVGLNRSILAVEWDGKGPIGKQKTLLTVQDDAPKSRMNDGKADNKGRLWFGTMGYEDSNSHLTPNDGKLFKLERNHISNPESMISPVNISNGLAWNKANDKFYYIDTISFAIAEYDYDNIKGTISNRKVVFDLPANNISGGPDGMTIDKDDNLWVALYNGGSIIKVNPQTGKLLQRIPIPASAVTSAIWGGPNLDILFVTTSRYILDKDGRAKQPGAGSVYAITNLGTSGLPVFDVDVIDSI